MWTHVDRGVGGVKNLFCGRHKWMTPNELQYAKNSFLSRATGIVAIGLGQTGKPTVEMLLAIETGTIIVRTLCGLEKMVL